MERRDMDPAHQSPGQTDQCVGPIATAEAEETEVTDAMLVLQIM